MRRLELLIFAIALMQSSGCSWMKDLRSGTEGQRPKGKPPELSALQLVTHLNYQATYLQSIDYGNTRTRVSGKGIPVSAILDGSLASAQPRNFRMISSGRLTSAKVDMGSNDDQFWIYLHAPGDEPSYVFASHNDFEAGQAKLPGGIPFEPSWVMQALGMKKYDDGLPYRIDIQDKDWTYTLSWEEKLPGGATVIKEVIFDADTGPTTKPRVKKHVIRDARSKNVIAFAEIKSVQRVLAVNDHQPVKTATIQYPTHVLLRWEEQKLEMDMILEKAQVNQNLSRELFARPEIRGTKPIDLARYDFTPQR